MSDPQGLTHVDGQSGSSGINGRLTKVVMCLDLIPQKPLLLGWALLQE